MEERGKRHYAGWTAAAYVFTFAASALPGDCAVRAGVTPLRAVAGHILLFALLSALTYRSFIAKGRGRALVITALLVVFTAVATEVIQLGVPGRNADWRDLAFNLCGAAAGLLAVMEPPRETTAAIGENGEG